MARARPAAQRHDAGHRAGDAVGQRLGHVAHGRGQAAVGEVRQRCRAKPSFGGSDGSRHGRRRRDAGRAGLRKAGPDGWPACGDRWSAPRRCCPCCRRPGRRRRSRRVRPERLLSASCRRARQRPTGAPRASAAMSRRGTPLGLRALAPGAPARVDPALAPGLDAATDHGVACPEAAFQTLTKRAMAVNETRTSRTQSTGTKMTAAQEGDAEQEHALAPLHEAALGREPERLRLGPLVGDERGHRQDGHGQQRQVAVAPVRPGTRRTPNMRTASATRSVTESKKAPRTDAVPAALATGPSNRSCMPGDDQEDDGEVQVARRHQHGRDRGRHQAGRGEHVSGDAMAVECLADRTGGPVDGSSPTTVEHEAPRRRGPGGRVGVRGAASKSLPSVRREDGANPGCAAVRPTPRPPRNSLPGRPLGSGGPVGSDHDRRERGSVIERRAPDPPLTQQSRSSSEPCDLSHCPHSTTTYEDTLSTLRSTSADRRSSPSPRWGPSSTTGARPGRRRLEPTVVKAVETDFHIASSKNSFGPGKYAFVAQNKGQTTHALEITGPGLQAWPPRRTSAGPEREAHGDLQEGRLRRLLPVPGHKAAGHERQPQGRDRPARPRRAAATTTTASGVRSAVSVRWHCGLRAHGAESPAGGARARVRQSTRRRVRCGPDSDLVPSPAGNPTGATRRRAALRIACARRSGAAVHSAVRRTAPRNSHGLVTARSTDGGPGATRPDRYPQRRPRRPSRRRQDHARRGAAGRHRVHRPAGIGREGHAPSWTSSPRRWRASSPSRPAWPPSRSTGSR